MMLRCDVRDLDVVHAASLAGFEMMDTIVYTAASPALVANLAPPCQIPLRSAVQGDSIALAQLARQAFTDYVSHYHADPRLRHHASDIYEEWAGRLCDEQSDDSPVIIAEEAGVLAGFVALRSSESTHEADCELVAVAPSMTGRGVFKGLLSAAADWGCKHGIAHLTYSTQIQNTQVLRTITRCGFSFDNAKHTFHKWVNDGGL
jgi:GNAT superfamily N-acetyltransferase